MGLFHGSHSKLQVCESCKGYNSHVAAAVRFLALKYQKIKLISIYSINYPIMYHYFGRLHRLNYAPMLVHRESHIPSVDDGPRPVGHLVDKNLRVPV